jgi:O-antigen/teichoic acid export membrane protein
VADQVVSSLSNFAVSIYVVHALGAVQFGAFSLAFVTYGFVLNASRGLATGPLMVRFSGTDLPAWRRAVTDCSGTAVLVGLVAGACMLAAATVLSAAVGGAFLALGLTLPGLLLQDSWRYSFFALGRGSKAFVNDAIWALTLLPALAVLRMTGHADVFWLVFAWGVTGNIAAAVGPWQARVVPRLAGTWRWVSEHRDLGPRYLAEGTSQNGATQIRAYSIGLVLGLAALGSVQAAATLFGPMTILLLGMSLVDVPEAARVLRRSPRHLPLFCLVITGGLSVAGFGWGIFLLVAIPRGFGSWLLGPIWRQTYPLILPTMLGVMGQGINAGAGTGLHALGAARRSLRLTVLGSVLYVIGSLAGAVAEGVTGAVWGAAAGVWAGAVYGWWQLRVAQREAGHVPAGHRFRSIRPNWRRSTSPVLAAVPSPDATVPGDTVRQDSAPTASTPSPATLPSTPAIPGTGWHLTTLLRPGRRYRHDRFDE